MQHLVGQGYDGASYMVGCFSGVKKDVALLATYVHCASHVLIPVFNTSLSVSDISNMFGSVREVTRIINAVQWRGMHWATKEDEPW